MLFVKWVLIPELSPSYFLISVLGVRTCPFRRIVALRYFNRCFTRGLRWTFCRAGVRPLFFAISYVIPRFSASPPSASTSASISAAPASSLLWDKMGADFGGFLSLGTALPCFSIWEIAVLILSGLNCSNSSRRRRNWRIRLMTGWPLQLEGFVERRYK